MASHRPEHGSDAKNLWCFLAGLLAGTLVGAAAMLLLAPQAGKKTRSQIKRKGAELREQTVDAIEEPLAQARAKAGQITDDVRAKTDELEQRAQVVLDEQGKRVASAVKAVKKTVRDLPD